MDRARVNENVVEVGPAMVRGPCPAAPNVVSAALAFIDDDIAILDDAPVTVDAIWRRVFDMVLLDRRDDVVLICPTWWPLVRVERVRDAALAASPEVVVRRRVDVMGAGYPSESTVIEIAPECVVVVRAGQVVAAEPRSGELSDIARSVATHVRPSATVIVDAPAGVVGGTELARALSACLRDAGAAVTVVHRDRVLRYMPVPRSQRRDDAGSSERYRGRPAVLTAVVVAALVCVGVVGGPDESDLGAPPMTILVEGRVAMKVPALWTVRRVTSGPGSARVQVSAPDGSTALLMTQSRVRNGETLSTTSATLRRALDEQTVGVFSRFNPDDRRADRRAVTYREIRERRQIDWTVVVDGSSRIAVGCQSVVGGQDVVRYVCEEAIRSAHSVI